MPEPCTYNPTVDRLLGLGVALGVLTSVFGALERRFAAIPHHRTWKARSRWVDVGYWFLTPLFTRPLSRGLVVAVVAVWALVRGVELDARTGVGPLVAGSWVTAQPAWLQVMMLVVALDFVGYWVHRWFHRGRAWRFHAIHHSSQRLDWLAGARLHPVNDAIGKMLRVFPMLLLGFDPTVVAGTAPVLGLYAILLHANVPWDFGHLRYVIATPSFHRWHHTREAHGLNTNFAGLLPVWDILFGTFHMPRGAQPRAFGVDDRLPDGLWAQLMYPFRSARGERDASVDHIHSSRLANPISSSESRCARTRTP